MNIVEKDKADEKDLDEEKNIDSGVLGVTPSSALLITVYIFMIDYKC